jgi:hypothetical protein
MPQYDLHVLCSDCGRFHDARHRVWLAESFDVRCVTDLYPGQVPDEFHQAIGQMLCPTSKQPVRQTRADLMVLVAEGR